MVKHFCTICREDIVAEDLARTVCGHVYHSNCIIDWWANNNQCPLCRVICIDNKAIEADQSVASGSDTGSVYVNTTGSNVADSDYEMFGSENDGYEGDVSDSESTETDDSPMLGISHAVDPLMVRVTEIVQEAKNLIANVTSYLAEQSNRRN